jgi:GGDEF domain-containing protein
LLLYGKILPGHAVLRLSGDAVLLRLVELCGSDLREEDLFARFGG